MVAAKLSMVKFITLLHLVSGFNLGGDTNEAFEKMMQVALATFFFGLLATNTVFRIPQVEFVDKDNRKYYVKDDHKAIYWHKIDGKLTILVIEKWLWLAIFRNSWNRLS